jgi:hypothetical protein
VNALPDRFWPTAAEASTCEASWECTSGWEPGLKGPADIVGKPCGVGYVGGCYE